MSRLHAQSRLPSLSLTGKLTLAFLLVGVVGVLLFAAILGIQTRAEFDRFLSDRDRAVMLTALGDYYAANGAWDDLQNTLLARPPLDRYSRTSILVAADGRVLVAHPPYAPDQQLTAAELATATAITVDGATVGYVIFTHLPPPPSNAADGPSRIELIFLRRVLVVAAISAAMTGLLALLLGFILARTLTRPVRELTDATEAMAGGHLQQRVAVRSRDEIGQLAASFNQMSADLARASQTRKQMTADLAHDLRTPLAVLRGYIEGLQEGRIEPSPALFTLLVDEVVHLQRLIEDLRVLSLADAGELSLNRRMVDPAALLERAGLTYMAAAEAQGVSLRVDSPERLPSVAVDTDRMAQVLNNLVGNALRHTQVGEVLLTATTRDGHVQLNVHDTGSGITPDDLPYVFDRFYRGDKARQRIDDNSSGLGLAIAKAIVEAHGGTLHVESTVGEGSVFITTLPIATAA